MKVPISKLSKLILTDEENVRIIAENVSKCGTSVGSIVTANGIKYKIVDNPMKTIKEELVKFKYKMELKYITHDKL